MALNRLQIEHAKGPFAAALKAQLEPWSTRVANRVNGTVGAVIASAASIVVSHPVHHVTGTTQINTIQVPADFTGEVRLIPDGLWTTGTSGNIALGTTAVVGKVLILHYDPANQKFYPSY